MPRMYCDVHWAAHLQEELDWLEQHGPVPWAWDKTIDDEVFHPDAVPHHHLPPSKTGMIIALAFLGLVLVGMAVAAVIAIDHSPLMPD